MNPIIRVYFAIHRTDIGKQFQRAVFKRAVGADRNLGFHGRFGRFGQLLVPILEILLILAPVDVVPGQNKR